jgi:lipoprotein-anchoring transpeptidase ErfK/SrfK
MKLTRRHLLTALAAPLASPFSITGKASAADEPFPIFDSDAQEVQYRFRKREVAFESNEQPGTIVVDSHKMFLYFVLDNNRAIRYGVGVGRQGSSWSGTAVIKRKATWPTWTPTPDQLAHHAAYAKWSKGMPGGTDNPLGARALYLFQGDVDTLYRIHGTEVPSSIGHAVSSGCIRMINMDVADLYDRVDIGTRVVVLENKSSGSLIDLLD